MTMSDIEVIEFHTYPEGELVSINISLQEADIAKLKDVWHNRVASWQPPLIDSSKNGINIHIPWTLKPVEPETTPEPAEDPWNYAEEKDK